MSIGIGSADVVVDGLAHLVRPLMVTWDSFHIAGVVCSANLARSVVFLKHVVMSSCLEVEGVVVVWVLGIGYQECLLL